VIRLLGKVAEIATRYVIEEEKSPFKRRRQDVRHISLAATFLGFDSPWKKERRPKGEPDAHHGGKPIRRENMLKEYCA
jgi:hypothetical protein